MINVEISANGTASQIPRIPTNKGNTRMPVARNAKLLKKEIVADIFPLERAVKSADAKIFSPQKRKPNGTIKNPSLVME